MGFFFKWIDCGSLQKRVQRTLNVEPLFGNGHKQVDAKVNPNPALRRILRSSVKRLDPQVSFDPLEKQLHLPALLVDVGNRLGLDVEVVREKHQPLLSLFVKTPHPTEPLGISFLRFACR